VRRKKLLLLLHFDIRANIESSRFSIAASSSLAGSIIGEWNAPPTGNNKARSGLSWQHKLHQQPMFLLK
jgi:hypothetical protein